MTIKTNAKDIEIFIFNHDENFLLSSLASAENILMFLDGEKTAGNISNIRKLSGDANEISIEPQEDETETKKHFGTDANGAQNADVSKTINVDVDISLTVEKTLGNDLNDFLLEAKTGSGEATFDSDYKRYNLGEYTTDTFSFFIKIEKLVNGVYYYKNIIIKNPVGKTPKMVTGSSDDSTLTDEYTFLGLKSKTMYDDYNRTTKQTTVNFS